MAGTSSPIVVNKLILTCLAVGGCCKCSGSANYCQGGGDLSTAGSQICQGEIRLMSHLLWLHAKAKANAPAHHEKANNYPCDHQSVKIKTFLVVQDSDLLCLEKRVRDILQGASPT